MRRKTQFWKWLPLAVVLGCLSLPLTINHQIRNKIGQWFLFFSSHTPIVSEIETLQLRVWQLEQENRRLQEMLHGMFLKEHISPLVARVVFRSYSAWNSSFWIDKGSDDNAPDTLVIAKNSPVLSGDALVGVVEYVGKKASLVRLITDSGIYPAVRVARTAVCGDALCQVAAAVETNEISFEKPEEKAAFLYLLHKLEEQVGDQKVEYLAKGELQGHGEPFWRTPGHFLRGIGFNYDWKDHAGPARDLRTGAPIDPDKEYTDRAALPLIQTRDLLVTSGLDGIFPPGLKVATVTSIAPLKEGDYAYEIQATAVASKLLDLEYVFVLPPQPLQLEQIPDRVQVLIEQIDGVK